MATYLLNATEEDMARWKARAAQLGQTFARFVRDALDDHCDLTSGAAGAVTPSAASPSAADRRPRAIAPEDHFKPDPKPTKAEKKGRR